MKALPNVHLPPLAQRHGTPFYLYDWEVMAERVRSLQPFDVIRYAQKANSNIHLLKKLRQLGVVVDAVSLGEIERALRAGYTAGPGHGHPAEIVFTADMASEEVLDKIVALGIPLNAGSPDMLEQLGEKRVGHPVWLRVNPGFGHGYSRKTNTGGEWSKHGIWHEHLKVATAQLDRWELDLVGLHMHIGSGTDLDHLKKVCEAMVAQVRVLERDISALSAGGGLPIPYRGEEPFDTRALFELWNAARREIEGIVGHSVSLEIEPGRYLAAEAGILVARVRAVKRVGNNRFAVVDAGFDNLVRPAMYGAYHGISVVDKNGDLRTGNKVPTVIAGPLCESGDVFTQEEGGVVAPRSLPETRVGDLVVFHDAGAYASSMASNYNSRLLAPEILVEGRAIRQIRRRQTIFELLQLEAI